MDFNTVLYGFMDMVAEDPRLGPSHISLFMAILFLYKQQDCQMPVSAFSRQLMKQAKISAVGTYHKCIQELKEYGYINYIPSFNPLLGSLVYLNSINS
jgi:hypothetical protein